MVYQNANVSTKIVGERERVVSREGWSVSTPSIEINENSFCDVRDLPKMHLNWNYVFVAHRRPHLVSSSLSEFNERRVLMIASTGCISRYWRAIILIDNFLDHPQRFFPCWKTRNTAVLYIILSFVSLATKEKLERDRILETGDGEIVVFIGNRNGKHGSQSASSVETQRVPASPHYVSRCAKSISAFSASGLLLRSRSWALLDEQSALPLFGAARSGGIRTRA